MGFTELLKPDPRLVALLPKATKEKTIAATEIKDIIPAWKKLMDTFRGIRSHNFRPLPYQVLKDKKRSSLRSIASEMKSWDDLACNY